MAIGFPCRLCLAASSCRLLINLSFVLGLLCHNIIATSFVNVPVTVDHDDWGSDKLLNRWRGILSALADNGQPVPSVFEQAFTATFNSKEIKEVERTLEQFAQLVRWVEATPKLNATQLAFVPEFSSATALEVVHAAMQLSKSSDKDPAAMVAALSSIAAKLQSVAVSSPWRGYPAMRRVLVGALLKKRLDFGSRFPAKIQVELDRVMLQLFQLHKVSAANRGAVQFFHISKSGGTNLCQAAESNGCASQGFDTRTNCLIRDFSDQPRWVTYNAHKFVQHRMSPRQALPWFVNFHTFRPPYTCEQRRAYLLRDGLTFYANEYTNPPGSETFSSMCEDFVNLLMFRHPHDRLRSQIGWVQKLYKEFYMDVDTQQAFVNRTTGFWERLLPAGVNNYYIRSLLGQRFFEFPILEVAPEHVALAKLATLQHDILLTLEDKSRNELALRMGLGWSQALRDSAVRSSTEMGDVVALPLDYDAMLDRNAPDVEVYLFAQEMQALDSLVWNFASIAGEQLGAKQASTDRCGYVSTGTPAATAALAARLSGFVVPPNIWQPAGWPADEATNSTSSSATSSIGDAGGDPATGVSRVGVNGTANGAAVAAARAEAAAGSKVVDVDRSGEGDEEGAAGFSSVGQKKGAGLLRLGADAGVGQRGASVVTINRRNGRHLLRLKHLKGVARRPHR